MANYKTANLKPETMQRLREYAVGDESVDSTVQRLLEQSGSVDVNDLKVVSATPEDLTKLRSDLLERLDKIENAAKTAEERTGTIENRLDDMGGR